MDMVLPATIDGTSVLFVTTDEAERYKARKEFILLNMFGSFTADTVEFTIVTFAQNFRPQHDCSLDLLYTAERNEFELVSVAFAYPYPASGRVSE